MTPAWLRSLQNPASPSALAVREKVTLAVCSTSIPSGRKQMVRLRDDHCFLLRRASTSRVTKADSTQSCTSSRTAHTETLVQKYLAFLRAAGGPV